MTALIWCLWAFSRRRALQKRHRKRFEADLALARYFDALLRMELSPRTHARVLALRAKHA